MKTYNDLIAEISKYPNGTIKTQVDKISHLVDLEKMSIDDPVYFDDVYRTLGRGQISEECLFLSIEHYHQLKKINPDAGNKFRELVLAKKEEIKNYILNLDLSKPKVENIKQYLSEYKNYGKTILAYEFIDVQEAIQKAYGFKFRGIYGSIKEDSLKEILKNEIGFTDEAIEIGYRTRPTVGNLCAKIIAALNCYIHDNDIPYIDHWHHLLDRDFNNLIRGGINYMNVYNEDQKIEMNPIHSKFRQIYTLECKVGMELKKGLIPFHVDW